MEVICGMLKNPSSPRHDRRDANDARCSGPKWIWGMYTSEELWEKSYTFVYKKDI